MNTATSTSPTKTFNTNLLLVLLSTAAVAAILPLNLLFLDTTAAGGDLTGHFYGPDYLRDTLLPTWRVSGWSNDMFAGFPIYFYYFPLPALMVIILDLFVGYGTAFKLVVVAGPLTLPAATYLLGKALKLKTPLPGGLAAGAAAFVLYEHAYTHVAGGSWVSVWAGEFSFSWGFTLLILFLGACAKTVNNRKWGAPAAVLAAACCLSHAVPAALAGIGWGIFLLTHIKEREAAARLLTVGAVAVLLTGFWSVPLLTGLPHISASDYPPVNILGGLIPLSAPDWVAGVFVAGTVIWMIKTRVPKPVWVLPGLFLAVPVGLFLLTGTVGPIWNGRVLPFWFYGTHLFLAAGVTLLTYHLGTRRTKPVTATQTRTFIIIAAAASLLALTLDHLTTTEPQTRITTEWVIWVTVITTVTILAATRVRGPVPASTAYPLFAGLVLLSASLLAAADPASQWNTPKVAVYGAEGLERKTWWPEYSAFMTELGKQPPGRLIWEDHPCLHDYGAYTSYGFDLAPMWTEGTHPTISGVLYESSPITPYQFHIREHLSTDPDEILVRGLFPNHNPQPDFNTGVRQMKQFGVTYFAACNPTTIKTASNHPELTEIPLTNQVGAIRLFSLPDVRLIEPLQQQPVSHTGPDSFDKTMLTRWVTNQPLTPITEQPFPTDLTIPTNLQPGEITDLEITAHRISFRTPHVGTPHLLKFGWYPNWETENGHGPWKTNPAFILVVPTEQHVTLRFTRSGSEKVGAALTLLGLLTTAVWWTKTRDRVDRTRNR